MGWVCKVCGVCKVCDDLNEPLVELEREREREREKRVIYAGDVVKQRPKDVQVQNK